MTEQTIMQEIERITQMLDGRGYRTEISPEASEALANNPARIVVAFGASDDLVELRGAIHDELDAWEGCKFGVTSSGMPQNQCEDEDCPYFAEEMAHAKRIRAIWNDDAQERDAVWTFETGIPHKTFTIMEDGEPFCRGIVFSLDLLD